MTSPVNVNAELYGPIENYTVIRLPGRHYPGVLVQGDSLSILAERIRSISIRADSFGNGALQEEAAELRALVDAIQERYETTLFEHGIKLPYYTAPKKQ